MTTTDTKDLETKSTKETKEEFASFCGFAFDPAKNSDCYTVCKKDEPEEFAKCLAHFETLVIKPKTKTSTAKGGRGKSHWGHINGTQAGLIDDALVTATTPLQLTAIAEFAQGKSPRVLHHLKHLVKNKGASVELTKDNAIYWKDNPNMSELKTHGSVSGLFLRKSKPAEKPKEDKALKDAEKAIEEEEKKEKGEGIVKKDSFSKIKLPADKKVIAKKAAKKAAKKEKK